MVEHSRQGVRSMRTHRDHWPTSEPTEHASLLCRVKLDRALREAEESAFELSRDNVCTLGGAVGVNPKRVYPYS